MNPYEIECSTAEFLAILKKFKQYPLTWNDTNERLVLTVIHGVPTTGVPYTTRYLSPDPKEMKANTITSFIALVFLITGSIPDFNILAPEPKQQPEPVTLTAAEFLEKFRNAEGRSVSTSEDNLRLVIYESVDDDPQQVQVFYGPDPSKTDFIEYMNFLVEIYKFGSFKDFVYSYVFSRLG